MNYSISERDALAFCSIQASIFEACLKNNKSELDFISKYMKSIYAKRFDDGSYWSCFDDQVTIIEKISEVSRNKSKSKVLDENKLRFAGYFYRYYCYRYKLTSVYAWREIPFEYVYDNYDVLHSLDISKACETAKEANLVSRDTK